MDFAVNLFDRGRYQECAECLDKNAATVSSPYDAFIAENNLCICNALINLSNQINYNCTEDELLRILNNVHAVGLPGELIPLHIELMIYFNNLWWQMASYQNSTFDMEKLEIMDRKLGVICERISGQCHNNSNSSDTLSKLEFLKDLVINKNASSSGICLEIIVAMSLIVLITSKNYVSLSQFIRKLLKDGRELIATSSATQEISAKNQSIFKFGLLSFNSNLSQVDAENAINILTIMGHICIANCPEIKWHNLVDDNTPNKWSTIRSYCQAFKLFKDKELDKSLGILLINKPNVDENNLLGRYHCLLGQIYCQLGEHQKATENLMKASKLIKNVACVYYYQGVEYGKMGLHEKMLTCYENMLKAIKKSLSSTSIGLPCNYWLLEAADNCFEIRKSEALYVLAVAYALNERFEEAMKAFQKLLNPTHLNDLLNFQNDRIIELPSIVAILHEATTIFILNGSTTQAEEICRQSMTMYLSRDRSVESNETVDAHGRTDKEWLRTLLEEDLKINVGDLVDQRPLYENYISFFDEDVIGLMLLSEIHRIQESDELRLTLNQVLLLLSKHIARMKKQGNVQEDEQTKLNLIKALTCKICLKIAKLQENTKPFAEVDRMYKRALSCNNGDKDVLYCYAKYLVREGKTIDAGKLWNTFSGKDEIVNVEDCQSLALKYLLRVEVSSRQLQQIVAENCLNR